jgi:hypothetical protein
VISDAVWNKMKYANIRDCMNVGKWTKPYHIIWGCRLNRT